jgi:hypothetical protein
MYSVAGQAFKAMGSGFPQVQVGRVPFIIDLKPLVQFKASQSSACHQSIHEPPQLRRLLPSSLPQVNHALLRGSLKSSALPRNFPRSGDCSRDIPHCQHRDGRAFDRVADRVNGFNRDDFRLPLGKYQLLRTDHGQRN